MATYYLDTGHGLPVVLIHGVGLDHGMWHAQADFLKEHYRVVRYDMFGHGQSCKPAAPYTLDLFEQQLRALLDEIDINRAHLVGFSMGGLVAGAFASRYPERVRSLVLASTVAERSPEQKRAVLDRVTEVEKSGPHSTIQAALKRWFTSQYARANPEVLASVGQCLENNDPEAYLAAYRVFATADEGVGKRFSRVVCPALIITGERDLGATPEMARRMHQIIENSKCVIVPYVKHILPVEGAEAFNRILVEFLARIRVD